MGYCMRLKTALALASAMTAILGASSATALTIELRNTGGAEVGTQARAGFEVAAHFWEKVITNDVNVKFNVGFQQLGAGILGSTGSTTNVAYVGNVFPALQGAGNSALDAIVAANLPDTRASQFIGGAAIDALVSGAKANGTGVQTPLTTRLDNDASGNNSAFSANTSLLKALGITPTYTGANAAIQADGSITFSNQFAFDFDPTDGIDATSFDFVGVAIHEIGHALGFRSGVDVYDANSNFAGNLNDFAIMSIWDIFRYSDQSIALGVNDWRIGGTPYFSIDGQTMYGADSRFSTGATFGNGRQASHWLDSAAGLPQLGILDPTSARGQQQEITSLDLAAYDAMGWNIAFDVMDQEHRRFSTATAHTAGIPEPATWALMIGGFFGLGGALRRRSALARATA